MHKKFDSNPSPSFKFKVRRVIVPNIIPTRRKPLQIALMTERLKSANDEIRSIRVGISNNRGVGGK